MCPGFLKCDAEGVLVSFPDSRPRSPIFLRLGRTEIFLDEGINNMMVDVVNGFGRLLLQAREIGKLVIWCLDACSFVVCRMDGMERKRLGDSVFCAVLRRLIFHSQASGGLGDSYKGRLWAFDGRFWCCYQILWISLRLVEEFVFFMYGVGTEIQRNAEAPGCSYPYS